MPAAAPALRQYPIRHRLLLDAVAAAVPSDRLPWIETATVTRLLRPVPWPSRRDLTSLLVTNYPALAIRVQRVVGQFLPAARVASRAPRRHRETSVCFEVLVPTHVMADLTVWLRQQWDGAARQVTARTAAEQRVAAARTMWRAALLVSSSDRRRAQVRVRVPGPDVLDALGEAGRALGLRVNEHSRRGDCHFITVDDPGDAVRLLRAVGAGGHAEAWVCHNVRAAGSATARSGPGGTGPGRGGA